MDIVELKVDGFGGYWLRRKSERQPNANGWYRATLSMLGEVKALEEKDHAQQLLDDISHVIENDPTEDRYAEALLERDRIQLRFEVFEHLATQQLGSATKAVKLMSPIASAMALFEEWLVEASAPAAEPVEPTE